MRRLLLLSFLFVSWANVICSAQQGPKRFLEWSIGDARDWATSMSWERGAKTGVTLALIAPISLLDEHILERQRTTETPSGEFLELANYLGGPEAKFVAIGAFGISMLTPSRKLQDATFTSLQSMIYAYALGSVSKRVLVGRSRPYEGKGAFDFELFSNRNSSFPSGHATTAWALTMPFIIYYPGVISFGLGVLASGTALARLKRQQHWVTDVLAGSFLGGATGYWLAKKHLGELPRFAENVQARVGPTGFSVTARF